MNLGEQLERQKGLLRESKRTLHSQDSMNRSLMDEIRQLKLAAQESAGKICSHLHDTNKVKRTLEEREAELDALRFRKVEEEGEGGGGGGGKVGWSDQRAAQYFQQERVVSHLGEERVKHMRRIR